MRPGAFADESRRILYIFLASPGDLTAERKIARQVADGINRAAARRLGIQIELLGWEDTLPGAARPQARINEDLDRCSLFIGILHRRWGSPSGAYDSGFEEEYCRSIERRRLDDSPEMWLFFKSVPAAEQKDAGPQLKRVLDFKQEVVDRKELLFKEFESETAFQALLQEYLLQYILELGQEEEVASAERTSTVSGRPTDGRVMLELPPNLGDSSADLQINVTLEHLRTGLRSFDAGHYELVLSEDHRARIALLNHLSMADVVPDHTLGASEAVLVYRQRQALRLTLGEVHSLTISCLSDPATTPAWYWLRNVEDEALLRLLNGAVANQHSAQVSAGAARHIVRFASGDRYDVGDEVLVAALRALPGGQTSTNLRRRLSGLRDDQLRRVRPALQHDEGAVADSLLLMRDVQADVNAMLRDIVAGTFAGEAAIVGLYAMRCASDIARDLVPPLTSHVSAPLRQLAARVLGTVDLADPDADRELQELLADPNPLVMLEAVEALTSRARPIDTALLDRLEAALDENELRRRQLDEVRLRQLRLLYGPAPLATMADPFAGESGIRAYAAVLGVEGGLRRAREDLSNDFENLLAAGDRRSTEVDEDQREEDLGDIKDGLRLATLRRLLQEPSSSDEPLALRIANEAESDSELANVALQLLGKVGSVATLQVLAERLRSHRGSAYQLQSTVRALVVKHLDVPDRTTLMGRAFLLRLVAEMPSEIVAFAEDCLTDDSPAIRRSALSLLLSLDLDAPALEQILQRYLTQSSASVDVVCALDELLYLWTRNGPLPTTYRPGDLPGLEGGRIGWR